MKLTNYLYSLDINVSFMGHNSLITPALIKTSSETILIDTGFPNTLDSFESELKKLNLTISDLTGIILTHQDIDHVGNVSQMKKLNNNIEVMALNEEVPYIDGTLLPHKLNALEENKDNLTPELEARYNMFKKGFANTAVNVDRILTDGETLNIAGGIQVIHTPGHTLGHTCLYFTDNKILIAGDMLFSENNTLKAGRKGINFDDNLYKESLEKLTNYDIQTIVLYHGGVLKGNITEQIQTLFSSL